MLSFENDYSCTATPEIIERISEIAQNQYPGYGNDSICESAKAKIREACACPDAQIFFLVGGTQTNQTIIDSITPQYAGVIAASTGHVNVHEAGAIEFTGHKVLTLPHHDGKMRHVLRGRQLHAHGVPRMRLHFAGHRIRHALHARRT